jgi:predicted CXXCH cytochrome family protein
VVLGRFEIPPEELAKIRVVSLASGGTRGHPTPEHLTVGTPARRDPEDSSITFSGDLDCLSCHDPHKGTGVRRFRGGAIEARDMCLRCHRK